MIRCDRGHRLKKQEMTEEELGGGCLCDCCRRPVVAGDIVSGCSQCRFVVCGQCESIRAAQRQVRRWKRPPAAVRLSYNTPVHRGRLVCVWVWVWVWGRVWMWVWV